MAKLTLNHTSSQMSINTIQNLINMVLNGMTNEEEDELALQNEKKDAVVPLKQASQSFEPILKNPIGCFLAILNSN